MAVLTMFRPFRPAAVAPEAQSERTGYAASGARKTTLSFLMLLLLPFFASLPVMLFQRFAIGQWYDTMPLAIVGVFFSALMLLLLMQLMFSLRARLSLGETAVTFTLPSGRGPTPMLRYASHAIPYSEIQAVGLRREVFGGSYAPIVLQGAHILTKAGASIPLGYVSEANVDPAFPYPAMARQIAARARIPVTEEGGVWRTLLKPQQAKALGIIPGQSYAVTAADIEGLNRSHRRMIVFLVNLLVTLVLAGIAMDFVGR